MENTSPRISIITVVFNAAGAIENTILSVLNQTYRNIEYIIIDGGSTDGTVDIMKKYEKQISYWTSQADAGIYDALNKGIDAAAGDWIGLLNTGDVFAKSTTIEEVFSKDFSAFDVLYGNSWAVDKEGNVFYSNADAPLNSMWKFAVYRHGASFVKAELHKKIKFSLDKKLGFSADFDHIYKLYKNNCKFHYRDIDIVIFQAEGISNNRWKNIKFNFKIATKYEGIKIRIFFIMFLQLNEVVFLLNL